MDEQCDCGNPRRPFPFGLIPSPPSDLWTTQKDRPCAVGSVILVTEQRVPVWPRAKSRERGLSFQRRATHGSLDVVAVIDPNHSPALHNQERIGILRRNKKSCDSSICLSVPLTSNVQ